MTAAGYIQPDEIYIKDMFFRKPGLPILMVQFPDGTKRPYWNTFYQEEHYPQYLGQMDLNIQSPKVLAFLSGNTCQNCVLWSRYCAFGCFCLCAKGSGKEKFSE